LREETVPPVSAVGALGGLPEVAVRSLTQSGAEDETDSEEGVHDAVNASKDSRDCLPTTLKDARICEV